VEVDLAGVFRDLVRLETDLWNRVDARVHHEHGLPLAWLEVMQVISTTPGCRVLDVAEALFITVGGASKVVDKVEARGWCRRRPNPSDGRSSLIELTERGNRLLAAAKVTFDRALAADLGCAVPTAELAGLSDTLGRVRRHLITTDPTHSHGGK
jgi:DNA-binding MarR family transcriptional regulator